MKSIKSWPGRLLNMLLNIRERMVPGAIHWQKRADEWITTIQGYILGCLDEYSKLCDDTVYEENLKYGFSYYREHFFELEWTSGILFR